MNNILEKIISVKRQEIARQKEAIGQEYLEKLLKERPVRSFRQALSDSQTGIISEFKRKSPSRGWIFRDAEVGRIVPAYAAAGATAISVLTDEPFFGGSLTDLKIARSLIDDTPILRKDFIVDAYQLYQAQVFGADAVLLIAAALTVRQTAALAAQAHTIGLEVLLEIHTEKELEHVNEYVDVVGINNRNLSTFRTDTQVSFELGEKIPASHVKISESGLSDPQTVNDLREAGFRGFLMGENFMKTDNPGQSLSDFCRQLKALRPV
jgi:indole-3-glycerol phosphate synthase